MQLSKRFRRGIILPLDNQAEEEIRAWQTTETTKLRFLAIESAADFQSIWNTGIFTKLNQACGTQIDDYEEELLEPQSLDRAIDCLLKYTPPPPQTRRFHDALLALLIAARDQNRPVAFVL